ncbi:hypothetical protein AMTRI_Chr08g210270 [Amborella trichopoda]
MAPQRPAPRAPDPRAPDPSLHLLELNIISAQDIHPATQAMHPYAVAWVHRDHKLSTRTDPQGHTEPTWNDKFIFRVTETFLRSDTAAVTIQIFTHRPCCVFPDPLIGTVRVLVGNLLSAQSHAPGYSGMRFTALQVRRPSGRPQGILNLGITLLDPALRSMPLYVQATSALGYQDLMGQTRILRRSKSAYPSEPASSTIWTNSPGPSELSVGEPNKLKPQSNPSSPPIKPMTTPRTELTPIGEEFYPAEVGSSVLEDWSVASSGGKEELKLKLERWRMELPPIYDPPGFASIGRNPTRRDNGRGGPLGCFKGMDDDLQAGCECSIFCGLNPRKKNVTAKIHLSPSDVNMTRSMRI